MSILNYYRIGKTILWQGAPFRIAVRTDYPRERFESLIRLPAPTLTLSLQPINDGNSTSSTPPLSEFAFHTRRGWSETDFVHFLEIQTTLLPIGPYEIRLQIGPEDEVDIPEHLFLLTRSQHQQMVRFENQEEFLPSAPLKGPYAVENFINKLLQEFFEDGLFTRDKPELQTPRLHVRWDVSKETSFASAPIRWVTEGLLYELTDLSVRGIKDFNSQLEVTSRTFKLEVQAYLLDSVSQALAESIKDRECGHLYLLNAANDLPDFEVNIGLVPGSPEVRMSIKLRINEFPVLPEPQPEPAPRDPLLVDYVNWDYVNPGNLPLS